MKKNSSNIIYHLGYWILVIMVLIFIFGLSWKNNLAALYFICMLLPVVLGTSYFFNYFLVPRYFFQKKYLEFSLYSIYTLVISLYLESIVLILSLIYLGKFSFENLGPNASETILLGVLMY